MCRYAPFLTRTARLEGHYRQHLMQAAFRQVKGLQVLASLGLGLGAEKGLGKSLLGRRTLVGVWMHQHVGKADGLLLQGMSLTRIRNCITALQSQAQKYQLVRSEASPCMHKKENDGQLASLLVLPVCDCAPDKQTSCSKRLATCTMTLVRTKEWSELLNYAAGVQELAKAYSMHRSQHNMQLFLFLYTQRQRQGICKTQAGAAYITVQTHIDSNSFAHLPVDMLCGNLFSPLLDINCSRCERPLVPSSLFSSTPRLKMSAADEKGFCPFGKARSKTA